MLPSVVMKFGGTSLGTADAMRRTAKHILDEKRPVLVVASAVGGVTDLLLQAAAAARLGGDPDPFLREVRVRHEEIVQEHNLRPALVASLDDELTRLLQGISMLGEFTPRVQDMLLSLGERSSVRLLAEVLNKSGGSARAFDAWDLGLTTGGQHGRAEPLPVSMSRIREKLEATAKDEIPVVTGFIAKSQQGEITTLGRGGSDLSAAIFGAAAGCEEIQIWTDVPGILRADPRVVPDSEVLPALRFEEAAELAFFGAKVLHPRTIEPARSAGIPVRVLGTFQSGSASDKGTLIHDAAPPEPVRALAIRRQVESLHVHSLRMLEAHGFLSRVFEILARYGISVDVIATSEVSISMTFDRVEADLKSAVKEISEFAEVEQIPERSILCVVGAGLREDTSLLARIFKILADHQIPVHVISQGASRINITLVTDPPHGQAAMRALYENLF
jgi:aspartate kinase